MCYQRICFFPSLLHFKHYTLSLAAHRMRRRREGKEDTEENMRTVTYGRHSSSSVVHSTELRILALSQSEHKREREREREKVAPRWILFLSSQFSLNSLFTETAVVCLRVFTVQPAPSSHSPIATTAAAAVLSSPPPPPPFCLRSNRD